MEHPTGRQAPSRGRGLDDELLSISSTLPMVVRLNARMLKLSLAGTERQRTLRHQSEQEWLAYSDSVFATLYTCWIRGRWLAHFLLGTGQRDVVKARQYLPGWELATGSLRDQLEADEAQMSKVVAHLLRKPGVAPGLSSAMPATSWLGSRSCSTLRPRGTCCTRRSMGPWPPLGG